MERKKYVTEKISEKPELPLSCKQIFIVYEEKKLVITTCTLLTG